MRRSRWNVSISRKTLRKPPGGSASSTRCGKSCSFARPTISRLRRVICKATEHRLPQQTNQRVAAVLARACIGEHLARRHAQPKSVVEFAVGQQPGIRGDNGAAKLQRQAAVEIEPNSIRY